MLKTILNFYLGLVALFFLLIAGIFLARVVLGLMVVVLSNPITFFCVGLVIYWLYKKYEKEIKGFSQA